MRVNDIGGVLRILLVTDAWEPQVNGVVRTLKTTARELSVDGPRSALPHAAGIPHAALSDLSRDPPVAVARRRQRESHHPRVRPGRICTSPPKVRSGMAARRFALRHDFPFTTAYHTRFPEYVHARLRLPLSLELRLAAPFPSALARRDGARPRWWSTTSSPMDSSNVKLWSRGVDTGHLSSAASKRLRQRAADLPVRRPRGGGEKRRGVPRSSTCRVRSGWWAPARRSIASAHVSAS